MNVNEIKRAIRRIIKRHKSAFDFIGTSQTKLLELGAITGMAEHYKSRGYTPRVVNPKGKRSFIVKTSTRGYPWNFSKIIIEKEAVFCELHMNVVVEGAHGVGTYCVDVGVIEPGSLPFENPTDGWVSLENTKLITFAEVKKLVIYPMLLAQFIGIVHEIKPNFLRGRGVISPDHPSPALIVLGHYSANSEAIVQNFHQRGISVLIVANYDGRLSNVRIGKVASPLEEGIV